MIGQKHWIHISHFSRKVKVQSSTWVLTPLDINPSTWQTNRLGWINFKMQITTWMMTKALALALGLPAFCLVICVFLLPPSIPTTLIPSFSVKKHFKQQREQCFPRNWLGLLGNITEKKKLKRMKRTPHFLCFFAEYFTLRGGCWCEMTLENTGWTEQKWIKAQSVKAPRLLTWRQELLLTNYLWVLLRNPLPTQKKEKTVYVKSSHVRKKLFSAER